ncbi:MAG: sensor histidine kinase N-terminal domain-containing protein [Candidatus Thiodiazotropha sp. (ex Epidulcina cf. delphinae)]|nr:sensor histidine kinase N-terminal domain-containing protein [Candidatus Thiodiazotropha sp. (ex Epidulcina cf. delphinae)]
MTIVILWLIAASFVYRVAYHEVEEIYDATLAPISPQGVPLEVVPMVES